MIFGAFPLPVRFPRDSEPSPGDRNLWQMRCHGFPSSIRSRDYTRKWGLAVIKTFETLTGISSVRLRESNKSKRKAVASVFCFLDLFLERNHQSLARFSKKFLQHLTLHIFAPPRGDEDTEGQEAGHPSRSSLPPIL
mgnify:FL=1